MERSRRVRTLCYIALCILAIASPLSAGTIRLRWDGVPGASGYRIYFGTSTGQYTRTVSVGNRTEADVGGLADCTTWYLAVKAYNSAGESPAFSNEVSGWPRPEIRAISPAAAEQGSQIPVRLLGWNFESGAQANLDAGSVGLDINGSPLIRLDSAVVVSCSQMEALMTVEPLAVGIRAAEVGSRSLRVDVVNPTTVFGSSSVGLEVLFDEDRRDINRENSATDGRIDGADLTWLAFAYGSFEGEPLYNPDADLNGDGLVDGLDLAYLASGFGMCRSGAEWTNEACD